MTLLPIPKGVILTGEPCTRVSHSARAWAVLPPLVAEIVRPKEEVERGGSLNAKEMKIGLGGSERHDHARRRSCGAIDLNPITHRDERANDLDKLTLSDTPFELTQLQEDGAGS